MLENYCVSIPCKSYIRQYYGAIYGTPIDLGQRHYFHDTVLTKISFEPSMPLSRHKLQIFKKNLDAEITFTIPGYMYYRIDNTVTDTKVWAINRYLEKGFNDDLGTMVAIANVFGVEKRTAIEALSEKYGIILEEHITLDALKKKEQRFRQTVTFRNSFLASLSTSKSLNLRA